MEKKNYRLGLYEKAMPDFESWVEKLLLTRETGFDWLEISIDETDKKLSRLDWDESQYKELKNAIANTGVPIHTMCLSGHRRFPLGSHDPAIRAKAMDIMKKAIEFSAQTGVRLIQLAGYDVYYEDSDSDTVNYFEDGLAKSVELAAKYSVTMGFETMETPFLDTTEKGMAHVLRVNSPYLGMYPDIGNLKNAAILYSTDVVDDLITGRGHIFAAHLKETCPGKYRDMRFGTTGHTEYVRCVKELWSQGVRMFTGEFWHRGEENYAQIMKDSSAFLRARIEEAAALAEAE